MYRGSNSSSKTRTYKAIKRDQTWSLPPAAPLGKGDQGCQQIQRGWDGSGAKQLCVPVRPRDRAPTSIRRHNLHRSQNSHAAHLDFSLGTQVCRAGAKAQKRKRVKVDPKGEADVRVDVVQELRIRLATRGRGASSVPRTPSSKQTEAGGVSKRRGCCSAAGSGKQCALTRARVA